MQNTRPVPVTAAIRQAFLRPPPIDAPPLVPEPPADDPPDPSPACGWFGSSQELRQGLEVVELRGLA